MDPLTVFKDFVQNNQLDQVEVTAEGKVRFADKYSFPASAATAFRREGGYYSLGVVVQFYKLTAAGIEPKEYIRKFPKREDQVTIADRTNLRDYLEGKVATVPQLDENVPLVPFEPPAKRQKVGEVEAGETDALQHLFGHEKQLRDRNTLLCAPGADFRPMLATVDKVMAARKEMQAAAARGAAAKPAAGQQRPPGQPSGQQQQQQQKQQAFVKASRRLERAVDASGTLKALGADVKVAKELGLGYGLMPGAAAGASKSWPAAASQAGQKPGSSSSKGADPRAAAAAAGRPSSASQRSSGKLRPIILVPAGYSAMVNIYNAQQLLEHHRFIPSAEVQKLLAAEQKGKPTVPIEVTRKARRDEPVKPRYEVTDKVPKAGHPDWRRVVAVIVMGKPWQFKEFPFKGADKGDMVETFSNIFGAFFHYKDEKVPDAVQGWKVAKLPLRRDVRHLDDQVVLEFYDKLDAFLLSMRRSDLDY